MLGALNSALREILFICYELIEEPGEFQKQIFGIY